MNKSTLIAINKDNQYIVCTREGSVIAGPFPSGEQAVEERAKLGLSSGVDRGRITIMESDTKGFEGCVICIDNIPYLRFRTREDAAHVLGAFEQGSVGLIYKRFLGGLGDLIAVSGAAVMLSKMYGKLVLTSLAKYESEFKRIFVHFPEIQLEIALKDANDFMDLEIEENLLLHNASISIRDTHLDSFERVYKHFGVPYRYRWDACPIASACSKVNQIEVPSKPYVFVHDDRNRGFAIDRNKIDNIPVFHPSSVISESILSFKDVIENASEVHVFDSAFFHFTECLEPKGKLFFHRYVRPNQKRYSDYKTKHKWEILV
jgi:hypothetical protein